MSHHLHLSRYLYSCLSLCQSMHHTSVCLYCLCTCMCVCVCLSVCLSVSLSVSLSFMKMLATAATSSSVLTWMATMETRRDETTQLSATSLPRLLPQTDHTHLTTPSTAQGPQQNNNSNHRTQTQSQTRCWRCGSKALQSMCICTYIRTYMYTSHPWGLTVKSHRYVYMYVLWYIRTCTTIHTRTCESLLLTLSRRLISTLSENYVSLLRRNILFRGVFITQRFHCSALALYCTRLLVTRTLDSSERWSIGRQARGMIMCAANCTCTLHMLTNHDNGASA